LRRVDFLGFFLCFTGDFLRRVDFLGFFLCFTGDFLCLGDLEFLEGDLDRLIGDLDFLAFFLAKEARASFNGVRRVLVTMFYIHPIFVFFKSLRNHISYSFKFV